MNSQMYKGLIFLGILCPFIDIIRVIKFETSPLAGILSFLFLSLSFISCKKNSISRVSFFCCLFTLLLIVRIRLDYINDNLYVLFYFKTIISFILGISVLIFSSKHGHKLTANLLKCYILTWIFVGILQLSPASEYIQFLLKLLMTRSQYSENDGRGISMLANEPSYAGIYIVLFLVLLDYLKTTGYLIKKRFYILLFTSAIVTFSSNAMLLLFSYILLHFLFSNVKFLWKISFFIISTLFVFFLLNYSLEARSLLMLKTLLTNPSMLLNDQSLSSRFYFIISSYYGAFSSYFLGWGTGSYSFHWVDIMNELNIVSDVPQAIEIQNAFIEHRYIAPMSFLGGIAHDLGLLGLLIILKIIFTPILLSMKLDINSKVKRYIIISTFLVFSLWLQTASYSLPLPWFILGLNYQLIKNEQRNNFIKRT